MCEHGCRAFHNERHGGPNIRPRQLRNREVPWEGSRRSKLMSRRIPIPNRDAARVHVLTQGGLQPELCRNDRTGRQQWRSGGTRVSRGHSTGSNEPENEPDGLTTREGLNLAGRHDHRWSCPGAMRPNAELRAAIILAEKECCLIPQGLPGTAVRGPACTVVWEPGGETLPATRLGAFVIIIRSGTARCKRQAADPHVLGRLGNDGR